MLIQGKIPDMAQREATDLHPKVAAAAAVTTVLAAIFTILAAVGVIVPEGVQNAAAIVIADVAALIPLVVAYVKSA